jgi:hypothetical protein
VKLTVVAHAVSASAREKIEGAGGSVTLLREPKVKKAKSKPRPVAAEPVAEEPAAAGTDDRTAEETTETEET